MPFSGVLSAETIRNTTDDEVGSYRDRIFPTVGKAQGDTAISDKTVCIADPGYAGLPLTLAFPDHPEVVGFDMDAGKITD